MFCENWWLIEGRSPNTICFWWRQNSAVSQASLLAGTAGWLVNQCWLSPVKPSVCWLARLSTCRLQHDGIIGCINEQILLQLRETHSCLFCCWRNTLLKFIIEIKVVLYGVRVHLFSLILCCVTELKFCFSQAYLSETLPFFFVFESGILWLTTLPVGTGFCV